jgi:holo-[acyl-carrier protein] synthase
MFSVGVDIIEVERIARAIERWNGRFLERVYTGAELDLCAGRVPELAVRFAGKEAISKALGTGLAGVSWREMEVLADMRGKPLVYLHGRAAARASRMGLTEFEISLSHTREHAVAFVVGGTDGKH